MQVPYCVSGGACGARDQLGCPVAIPCASTPGSSLPAGRFACAAPGCPLCMIPYGSPSARLLPQDPSQSSRPGGTLLVDHDVSSASTTTVTLTIVLDAGSIIGSAQKLLVYLSNTPPQASANAAIQSDGANGYDSMRVAANCATYVRTLPSDCTVNTIYIAVQANTCHSTEYMAGALNSTTATSPGGCSCDDSSTGHPICTTADSTLKLGSGVLHAFPTASPASNCTYISVVSPTSPSCPSLGRK
ncbi:hypothetical protein WJX81_000652 [Elliptochloris bilobata]|uniref:Pherophorin domain-containing protein n=1 Tax=Elliptochloris bilobata TaxID=381761 RepID=A0AAW1RZI7_9CHLO